MHAGFREEIVDHDEVLILKDDLVTIRRWIGEIDAETFAEIPQGPPDLSVFFRDWWDRMVLLFSGFGGH